MTQARIDKQRLGEQRQQGYCLSDSMGVKKKHIKEADFIASLEKHGGIFSAVAKHLGLTRQAVYQRVNKSEKLQEVVAEARATFVDQAESALQAALKKQEPWAIRLVLLTLGKDRGYSKQLNVSGTIDNTGVVHILELPDNGRDREDEED